jgi:hypothetical protein
MSPEDFEQTLLRYKYHEPFEPFVVELHDGRRIEIGQQSVLFDQNCAMYITPDFEFVDFRRDQVRAIHLASQGVPT